MRALWTSDRLGLARFDCLQPRYNLVHRHAFERELEAVCRTYRLGVIPYSPLAGGFLTGKYRRQQTAVASVRQQTVVKYFTERNWALLDHMDIIAQAHHASVSQVALAWQLSNPVITSAIIEPRTLEQFRDNLGALEMQLSGDELQQLNRFSDWQSG